MGGAHYIPADEGSAVRVRASSVVFGHVSAGEEVGSFSPVVAG